MKNRKIEYNRHHIIAKSQGGSNNSKNILIMDVRQHEALHRLFNVDLPHDQIKKILDMSENVRVKEFKKEIYDLLLDYEGDYYINDVFR